MRLPLVLPATLLAIVASACAHPEHPAPAPVSQTASGAADAFGMGVTSVSPSRLTLQLADTAYAMVVRVFPGRAAELAYATRGPLAPGAHTLRLPVERTRTWVAKVARYTMDGSWVEPRFATDPACLMQHARYVAEHPEATQTSTPGTPPRPEPPCIPRRAPRQADTPAATGRWVVGGPQPLGEHYLVVIASATAFDPDALAQWLGEVDISRVRGEAAARAMPEYLMGDTTRWGAWIVHLP